MAVVRCQSDEDVAATEVVEGSDLGIVGDDTQVFGDGAFGPAPGVDTICVFPKNAARCKYNMWEQIIVLFRNSVVFGSGL